MRPFFNGLREEIKVELRMFKPETLGGLIDMTQKIEERNAALGRAYENKIRPLQTYWVNTSANLIEGPREFLKFRPESRQFLYFHQKHWIKA